MMKLAEWIRKLAGMEEEPKETRDPISIAGVGTLIFRGSSLEFKFDDQYLVAYLKPIDVSSFYPELFKTNKPQYTYVTNRHIGAQNFTVNWYPKVATPEGIVENVALVEQEVDKYFVIPECDEARFDKICRRLTPTLSDLGYEARDGEIQRAAKVVEIFFDSPQDAATYQKATTPTALPETKPVPPLPEKLQEAGKELLQTKLPEPKTLNQIKTEEQGDKLEEKASLKVEAGKKKSEDKPVDANDPARNAVYDVRLSKWDGQSASEKSQSFESVISLAYCPDRAAYSVKLPQGTRLNLSYETVKGYLLREGYQLEEANKHLEDAKKSEVVLRKEANLQKSAQLTKFLETVQTGSKLGKIADLLSKSVTRRDVFSSLLARSFENGEIKRDDIENYQVALNSAETHNTPESWTKLAEISNFIFENING